MRRARSTAGSLADARAVDVLEARLWDEEVVVRVEAVRVERVRAALGDAVVDHYVRCAEWEQEEFDKAVTDWELKRGFERA